MTRAEVEAKADDLLAMALESSDRAKVIQACHKLDETGLHSIGDGLRSARDMGVYGAVSEG